MQEMGDGTPAEPSPEPEPQPDADGENTEELGADELEVRSWLFVARQQRSRCTEAVSGRRGGDALL
jgi:hypothetical protein